MKCGMANCLCKDCHEDIPHADIEFSKSLLEFGLLPIGADIKKEFYITNLGVEECKWIMVEFKYNIDAQAYLEKVKQKNVSSYCGILKPHKRHYLTYNIVGKKPARYVSILVVFVAKPKSEQGDIKDCYNFIAQNICLVTYEITELNIVIKTGQSEEPILCPMQMLYSGIPIDISFKIKNNSLIPGCFYLLKPIGLDADKIEVEYDPQSGMFYSVIEKLILVYYIIFLGELKPRSSKQVDVKLTCHELGILEKIFLPCFIGKSQEPIYIRLLCIVDCLHVFFYMPTKNNEFQKILWPPKVVYEYDRSWSDDCLCAWVRQDYRQDVLI